MDWAIHVYLHVQNLAPVLDKLDQILTAVTQGAARMATDFTALQAQVQATTDAEQSAILLLNQLHADLVAAQASGDPAQVQAVIDALGTSQAALAAAVKANTPGA